jgi:hypothetical protein
MESEGGDNMRFIKTDSKQLNEALTLSKRLEFITICSEEKLDKSDLYIAIGGGVGFAISPDKELFNLFNNTGTKLYGKPDVVWLELPVLNILFGYAILRPEWPIHLVK